MSFKLSSYYGHDLEAMVVAKNYNRWILEEFSDYLRGHVAEVGAGIGNFSDFLLQIPIKELDLFEPSRNMYSILDEKFSSETRVKIHNSFFSGTKDSFDSVVYCNVMEHIADDFGEIVNVRKYLKHGGHLLIFVPALQLLFSKMDQMIGHHRRYNKKNLVNIVQQAGFEVVKAKYFDLLGIIPWYIFFVLLKKSYNQKNISLYDKVGIPMTKIIETLISPPFGKNLVVVAKRP